VVLAWDGRPAHKRREMTGVLRTRHACPSVDRPLGYAPELNPAEQLWGNVKGPKLANYCAENLQEMASI
jgi:transposase